MNLTRAAVPHVLFVLVDDLGHGNVGFHRTEPNPPPEVSTPNIDKLAHSGIVLHRHYVYRMCTPSRASLISGRFPVHVTQSLRNPESPNAGIPRNMTGIGHVLKAAGYKTHQVGKWDAGMATPSHTPFGRGFDTSLLYFEHKNDFWTRGVMQTSCLKHAGYGNITDYWDTDRPGTFEEGEYEEASFRDRVLSIITEHPTPATTPLFVLYTPHVAHCPLQSPQEYIDRFAPLTAGTDEPHCIQQTRPGFCPLCRGPTPTWPPGKPYPCRGLYSSMVSFLDDSLGMIVTKLQSRYMYENTLVILSSDNGGPLGLAESASTNHPLRGGKYSEFEGGIRSTAFVSGGYLPAAHRGTGSNVVMHIADWYATLSQGLANLPYPTDHHAATSGLPPLDSVNAWPALMGEEGVLPYTHEYIPLSNVALLESATGLKYLRGRQAPAGWQGEVYPNETSNEHPAGYALVCGGKEEGCLFNVSADPTEHTNLAEAMPTRLNALGAKLDELKESFYDNDDVGVDACPAGLKVPCACWLAVHKYHGTFGPFQEV